MRAEERRIRKLQEQGKLGRREADQMVETLDELAHRSRAARGRAARYRLDLSPVGVLEARFLVGELSAAELRAGFRRVALATGLAFVVGCGLTTIALGLLSDLAGTHRKHVNEFGSFAVAYWGMMGVAFAGSYYRQLAASTRRLSKLRRELDIARPELPFPREGRCAACGSTQLQLPWVRALFTAGWVTMPWLVIQELFLGQRLPKRFRRCESCRAIHVVCPSCGLGVESLHWRAAGARPGSQGAPCAHCGAAIPCWRNGWALLLELPGRWIGRRRDERASASPTREGRLR